MAQKMKHTMGERLNIRFNRKIKLEFHGARLTSDGALLAYRELDDALVASNSACETHKDRGQGSQTQPLCCFPDGRGCHKQGGICRDTIQDQSITMLFIAMSCFSMQPEGQVSLVPGFLEKSSEC